MIAGERSGDVLAARLVDVLQPTEVFGVVGPALQARGVRPIASVDALGVVGLTEAVRGLPRLVALHRRVFTEVRRARPDVVLTVDAPSFTLRLGEALRRDGIPVVHWVSPQIWAWRPGRAARIARSCDRLACLLPFEPGLYRGTGLDARFTGHPAADAVLSARPGVLGVAAGSRSAERLRLGPLVREVARRWGGPVIEACPPGLTPVTDAPTVPDVRALAQVVGRAVCCAGTASLELAAAGVPHVGVYRTSPITWAVARRLVRTRSVLLPNLVLGRPLVPELLQDALTPDAVLRALDALSDADGDALREVTALLRPGTSVSDVAELVRGVRG